MSEFGSLIRDARERLGLSPHRVAELIGRAPGTVRAWERGRTVPTDPFVVTSLAAVLAVDEAALFRAAEMEPPIDQPHLTIEQELASIAPAPTAPRPEHLEPSRARVVTDEQPAAGTGSQAPTDLLPGLVAGVPAIPSPESKLDVVRWIRRPQPAPLSAPVPTPPSGSYMDDPDERWSYRLRAVWTTAGVAILGVILLWAGSRTLAALGDAWDALLAGL
jgi:transcriptional regulator with XRE-family HTH domain